MTFPNERPNQYRFGARKREKQTIQGSAANELAGAVDTEREYKGCMQLGLLYDVPLQVKHNHTAVLCPQCLCRSTSAWPIHS